MASAVQIYNYLIRFVANQDSVLCGCEGVPGGADTLVLYHYPCFDGIFAALSAHLRLKADGQSPTFVPNRTWAPVTVEGLAVKVHPMATRARHMVRLSAQGWQQEDLGVAKGGRMETFSREILQAETE